MQKCFQGWQRKNRGSTRTLQKTENGICGHVLRGSSGLNALLIMAGKISGVKARGRPRSAWTDDLKDWTELRNYSELKRTAEDRTIWTTFYLRRRHKKKKKKKIEIGISVIFVNSRIVENKTRTFLSTPHSPYFSTVECLPKHCTTA